MRLFTLMRAAQCRSAESPRINMQNGCVAMFIAGLRLIAAALRHTRCHGHYAIDAVSAMSATIS